MHASQHASAHLERIGNEFDLAALRLEAKIAEAKADLILWIGTLVIVQMAAVLFVVVMLMN